MKAHCEQNLILPIQTNDIRHDNFHSFIRIGYVRERNRSRAAAAFWTTSLWTHFYIRQSERNECVTWSTLHSSINW